MKTRCIKLLLILFTFPAFSQERMTLTFEEAVNIGLQNNIELKKQNNQLIYNEKLEKSGMMSLGPSLNFRTQAWKTSGNQFIEQEARVVQDAKTNSVYGGFSANWTVFGGLSNVNNYKRITYLHDSQKDFVDRTEQDIINQIASQYLQVLLDMELLQTEKNNLDFQRKQYDQISELVSLGSRPFIDQQNQESQLRLGEYQVLVSESRLSSDKALLLQLLMLDPTSSLEVTEYVPENALIEFEDYNISDKVNSAELNRKDLSSAELRAMAAERNIFINRARMIPRIDLFANYGSRYTSATAAPFNLQLEDNSRLEYGITLSIPIFNNYVNMANTYLSKVNYENAVLDQEQTLNQVRSDVLIAIQNYDNARKSYAAAQAQYTAASSAYELNRESFELGMIGVIEFSMANRDFLIAQNSLTQAKYTLIFQKILVNYATGEISADGF